MLAPVLALGALNGIAIGLVITILADPSTQSAVLPIATAVCVSTLSIVTIYVVRE